MHTPLDTAALRFRRAAFIAAVAGLLCFAWLIYMLLHFNAGAASFRFGVRTMLGIASITLPGPVLLLFLASQARYAFCRIAGWVAIVPVLAVGAMPAYMATANLRPLFAPATYDAAVRASEQAMLHAATGNRTAIEQFRSVREELFKHPATQAEYAALHGLMQFARRDLEEHAGSQSGGMRAAMAAPFDDRGVSPRRRDEYLRLILPLIDPDQTAKNNERLLKVARAYEARLKMLTEHWGKWRWVSEKQPRFDDDALNAAYDVLLDGELAP
jgi:hypothetical protein